MDLGKSIRIGLINRDMIARDLAREMAVSQSYISGMCSGKNNPSARVIAHIAKILGYKVSEFIALGEISKSTEREAS